jgi:hypothetical protein
MIGLAGLLRGSGAKVIGDGGRSGAFPEDGGGKKTRWGTGIAKRRWMSQSLSWRIVQDGSMCVVSHWSCWTRPVSECL